ncbi:hypothetical protein HK103_001773 [Boothiomyces macroporosus]|uniref:FAD-binding FR-type domain-containing protein n=1 Tax=Boothiomyces macroporosus TaxID=261099 RepID=A0AAD5Y0Q8_9FUNG|nr:hypothetical protein HK103_001773 [Boothiomyces macroporosus]
MKWEDCLDRKLNLNFGLDNVSQLKGIPKLPETSLQITEEEDFGLNNLSLNQDFKAKIVGKKELNSKILEIKLDLTDLEWKPKSGDSFAIKCPNPKVLVERIMQRLDYNDRKISTNSKEGHLNGTKLVSEFLLGVDFFDFPKKAFFRVLAEYTNNQTEKKQLYYLSSAMVPECKPPLNVILQHLPALKPRFYSISESPFKTGKGEITFAFNLVENEEKKYLGICTSYLNSKEIGDYVAVFPRAAPIPFNLVPLNEKRLVLIANGTGIAPFVGFLQDLENYNNVVVVYGHRNHKDGIYDLPQLCANKTLIECFSRIESEFKYVQDAMPSLDLLDSIIYVCGSAPMGKGVHDALVKYYMDKNSCSMMEAIEFVNNLVKEGKYHRELW